jgi:hypothetical protein
MLKDGERCVPPSKNGERAACAQLRFRRDPEPYLSKLEEQLLKQALPS